MTPKVGEVSAGALLEVSDLRTHIVQRETTVEAVDGVSFSVAAGETLGIVGESGCGKTMTALSILGLLPSGGRIAGGSIRLDGTELVGLAASELRARRGSLVGMIFQDPMTSLNPSKTIGWQVGESLRIHRNSSKKEARDRAIEVLSLVGIPRPNERVDDFPHQLSGGMRQRVMIAIALACEPKLLIADEPTTALDVTIQAQILSLLDDLKERLGMGLVLVTHDLGVIAGRADRVLVMYAGRVVEEAGTEELFTTMRHPYTQALLASIPRIGHDRSRVLASIPGLPPDLTQPPIGCRFASRCTYVSSRCLSADPKLIDSAPGHRYACFSPVDGPLGLEISSEVRLHERALATVTQEPKILVSVRGIVKEFALRSGVLQRQVGTVHAVSSVSFDIRQGETFGIVGESGCGKTTLGRMMVGLEAPTSGSIHFDGVDITTLPAKELRRRRREFQLMFQDPYSSLDPRMRIGTALREPLLVQGVGSLKERRERVLSLLRDVGLRPGSLERYPHEFSGGQRQRIGFARALVLSPGLIVADEPVSALDVSIRSQIMNMMRQLQDAYQLTYAVISHDLSVVSYLADRVGVMYLGRMVEIGATTDVFTSPAHPYTQGLLKSVPIPDPAVQRETLRKPAIVGELPSAINPPSGCRFRTRCPFVSDRCAEEVPLLRTIGSGHEVACHHFEEVLALRENGAQLGATR
ncbi:MAG: ABC transporter ATP-binding protein [Ferrimicrobium sp.]